MGFRVKRGDKVILHYDGKLRHKTPGVVIKASQYSVWITFVPFASTTNETITAQFRVRTENPGRKFGGPSKGIFGWTLGYGWYRVYKHKGE